MRPIPPATAHIFSGLRPGNYVVRAEAPGFVPAMVNVTVPASEPVSLALVRRGAFMPALFGLPLGESRQLLESLRIQVSRVLDIAGREVAPANPGATYDNALVLVQVPPPGQVVSPEGSALRGGGFAPGRGFDRSSAAHRPHPGRSKESPPGDRPDGGHSRDTLVKTPDSGGQDHGGKKDRSADRSIHDQRLGGAGRSFHADPGHPRENVFIDLSEAAATRPSSAAVIRSRSRI